MLIIKSWSKARETHSRDPSADRQKDERSLYEATASSTRHFKAKAGQVSQVIISSEQPIQQREHVLPETAMVIKNCTFSYPWKINKTITNLIFPAKCTISDVDFIQNQCQIKGFRWGHRKLQATCAKGKWFLDNNSFPFNLKGLIGIRHHWMHFLLRRIQPLKEKQLTHTYTYTEDHRNTVSNWFPWIQFLTDPRNDAHICMLDFTWGNAGVA